MIEAELEEKLMQAVHLLERLLDNPKDKHIQKVARNFIDDNTPNEMDIPFFDIRTLDGNPDNLIF